MGAPKLELSARPDIFVYLEYRAFLRDYMSYLKSTSNEFSLRTLAKQIQISQAFLSMALNGQRNLSAETLAEIAKQLHLDESETSYLEWLRVIGDAGSPDEVVQCLKKIQRFKGFRDANSQEIETFEYLTHWQNVAIREMAGLADFQPDPKWIQSRLKVKVSLNEIRDSLEFLERHGFLERDEQNRIKRPLKRIAGKTGVMKPALTKFHKDMLQQAVESLQTTPTEERNISGHTSVVPRSKIAEAKAILSEAREKISALSVEDVTDDSEVYHFSFIAFPLTTKGEK